MFGAGTTAIGPRFGDAADRGELLSYPAGTKVLHERGLIWHRVGPSEAHARAAVVSGRLQLRTPAG